jgi:hypothetical protein
VNLNHHSIKKPFETVNIGSTQVNSELKAFKLVCWHGSVAALFKKALF